MRSVVKVFGIACVILLAATAHLHAEEGFWPFNRIPVEVFRSTRKLDLTPEMLGKVQRAALRFNNGGSGSFVSAHGLVMTNHHVATDIMQKLSSAERDLIKTGFHAKSTDEELKAADLELNQLVSIEDVSARVKAAVKPEMTTAEAAAARRAIIAEIEKESSEKTGLRSDVTALYRGAEHHLYRYRKFTDIRLVFAPEAAIGFFGGDPDNFTYPRYDLDVAFFRVYENGKPYETPDWFAFSKDGAKPGDVTLVAGNPGETHRLNTVAALEFRRDISLPLELKWLHSIADNLHAYAATSADALRDSQDSIYNVENTLKDLTGQAEGLKNPELLARKRADEAGLLKALPTRAADLRKAFDSIAAAKQAERKLFTEYRMLEAGYGFNSELFGIARTLIRAAAERALPDGERLPEFTEAKRASLEQSLLSPAPIVINFEKKTLAHSLALLQEQLGAEHPAVKLALAGKTPDARAADVLDHTKLNDTDERKKLYDGGSAALNVSGDPLLALARAIDAPSRELRTRYEHEVEEVETQAYDTIAAAWKEVGGQHGYPDGTFTLRLSVGEMKGYEEAGKAIPPFTTLGGLFDRAAQHQNTDPWLLPQNWLDAKTRLNLALPFNFVSNNDIIGGNSGSPVLNAKAEVVGLIFDGNIQSLIGDYYYDETVNRAVSVDVRAILETLEKIYGAQALVKEIGGK